MNNYSDNNKVLGACQSIYLDVTGRKTEKSHTAYRSRVL